MSSNQKQYKRTSDSGDYNITGESSNGINISKDGNNFIYSGNNEEYLQSLREGNLSVDNDLLPINDPNYVASFIGMYRSGGSDINLGNPNQQSLNINNTSDQSQNVINPSFVAVSPTALPSVEPLPSPTPTPSVSPNPITTDTYEDIQEIKFEDLPDEEGAQIFNIIRVDQNVQDNVPFLDSPSLVQGGNIVIKNIEKSNGDNVPKDGIDFIKYGSQYKLIQNDGTLGSQYYYPCALFNQGDPQWGSLRGRGYTLKIVGCAYNSVAMITTHAKNNAGYTPKWFWDNVIKSTVVYWDIMGKAVGLQGNLVKTDTTSIIDRLLTKGPLAFEWDNINKASRTSYANRYTKRHHWMVINGKNNNGTYTIFDPNGGKIWRNETKAAIEAGLIRIFYF